jgi:integrase
MTTTLPAPELKKIGGIYHVKIAAKGGPKWISTKATSRKEAEKVVAESGAHRLSIAAKAGRLTGKAIGHILAGKSLTVTKALDEYERRSAVSKSAKTVANARQIVGLWIREAGVGNLAPSSITPDHISGWINSEDSGNKRTTRTTNLAALRTFFEFCSHQGWIVSDPSRMVEVNHSILTQEQMESERNPFTDDEVKQLVSALRSDWHKAETGKHELFREAQHVLFWLVAVCVARETGLRLSDIAQLEWRSFCEQGKIVVWTKKTGKRVEHKISDSLSNLIGEIPVDSPVYLFPNQRDIIRNMKTRALLSVQFGRLLERLEIHGKSFHSLRHTFATRKFAKMDKHALAQKLAEALTMEEIAALLGHTDTRTSKGYVH